MWGLLLAGSSFRENVELLGSELNFWDQKVLWDQSFQDSAVLITPGFSQERNEEKKTLSLHSECSSGKAFTQLRLIIIVMVTRVVLEYVLSVC